MAIVYKANDILLNRYVAIKVLRQQYVHDEEFIRRFRREAQSAAALSHPNVVSIYDVGQQEDIYYIVMEYVEGHTLSELIVKKAPFQVEEAVHIASQICDALDHAHHSQIIHRDIKPHNILIGRNGRVKVTDFGIARAATEMEITQTGTVVGSVHYFSPEHAKGVAQGENSDLYSLGIVMYQMLTNQLPFQGESPISVALKHLQDDVVAPRHINPLIPQSVENIIMRSLRKAPEERYPSAHAMLEDLDKCLLDEYRNSPKAMFASDSEGEDAERTLVMPAIRSNQPFDKEEQRAGREHEREQEEERPFAELYEDEGNMGKKLWLKLSIWSVVLAVIIIGGWYGIKTFLGSLDLPKDIPVPNLIGMTYEEARAELEKARLLIDEELEYDYDDRYEPNVVIDQDPIHIEVKEHSLVKLTLSLGEKLEQMPNFIDRKWLDVEAELKRMGISDEQIVMTEVKDEAPAGDVIAQVPAADELYNPNATDFVVEITVSEGLGMTTMPNLIGSTLAEATVILEKYELVLDPEGPTYDASYTVEEGIVFHQYPSEPGDEVAIGEKVKLWISSGFPDDALFAVKSVTVEPEVEGEPSIVKISIRDARGQTELAPEEISETKTYPVQVVVSSDTSASIRILVNDKHYETETLTYEEALGQGGPGENSTELLD